MHTPIVVVCEALQITRMNIGKLIKIGISVVMLTLVVRSTSLEKIGAVIGSIPIPLLLSIIGIYTAGQVLSAFKWWCIAKSGGIHSPFPTALRAYFLGMFVNCFGLGTLGGDLARGLLLAHGQPCRTESVASVIADRAHGLAVLSLIALLATVAFGSSHLAPEILYGLMFMSFSCVVGWFLGPALVLRFFPKQHSLRSKVERVMAVFPKQPRTVLFISLLSACFHLLQLSLHLLMANAVGASLSLSLILVTVPFVNIASTLPISWNGLGVREQGYAFFLVPLALTGEQAVAMGAVWLLSSTVASAIGGLVAVMTDDFANLKRLRKADSAAAGSSPAAPAV